METKNSCVKIKRHKSLMKYRVCFFSFCKACNTVLCVWEERNQLWTNCNRINSETTTTLGVKGGDYFQGVFSLLRFISLVLVLTIRQIVAFGLEVIVTAEIDVETKRTRKNQT